MHFSLSDLAADITQNCVESGASLVELAVWETDEPGDMETPAVREFRFFAGDNGKGMTAAGLDRNLDPFVTDGVKHPGRKVGLGLPFLIQTTVDSGGGWKIRSAVKEGEKVQRSGGMAKQALPGYASVAEGKTADDAFTGGSASGTSVEAWFDLANVDTPPVGDIPGLFRSVLMFSGPQEIIIRRSRISASGSAGDNNLSYEVKKTELEEALGDLEDAGSLVLLGKYLHSLEGDD
ncbi:MAG: ATP-binding protein [Treponema sp.]|nr:ATP-binding protein [Treponema sp.]